MKTATIYHKMLLRLAFGILFASILILEFDITLTQASSNTYMTTKTYNEIYVLTGETVWSIASKFITNKEDIRELIFAIRHINGLSANAEIYPGQILKIPVKKNGFTDVPTIAAIH